MLIEAVLLILAVPVVSLITTFWGYKLSQMVLSSH